MDHYIGIDFGTTNSVFSVCNADGTVRTATYNTGEQISDTFRTVLCFWQENNRVHSEAGPWAVTEYLRDTEESRFIQSIKTYLASTTFTETRIYNQRFQLEDLISLFLKKMWARASVDLKLSGTPADYIVTSGRPVTFAGTNPDNNYAEGRLRDAYGRAGFKNVSFAYEPQGAAYYYANQLKTDARILVADFGGGTSDFSIIECAHENGQMKLQPIAHTGVGVAGDVFDFRIIDHLVSPMLGKGSQYESFGKWMDMPTGYYRSFASWHLLSMIKTPKVLREIEEIARTSSAPEKVLLLEKMIRCELGYLLYKSVAQAKAALSSEVETTFSFAAADIKFEKKLKRRDFEKWIAPDIARIGGAIDDAMIAAKLNDNQIDKVFMTGGTSFVPAVRNLIGERFGFEKLASGGEFTSVSDGLALIARERGAA